MEGLADKGNSPGLDSPKQWRCWRWKFCKGETGRVRGWSTMLWCGTGAVPLAVASMGTARNCSAQARR